MILDLGRLMLERCIFCGEKRYFRSVTLFSVSVHKILYFTGGSSRAKLNAGSDFYGIFQ